MPKASILVGLIALAAVPCLAQTPKVPPVNLAAVLGFSGNALPQNGPLFLAGGGTGSLSSVTCTATCGTDPSVSCTVSSGTCTAANRSCPGERGHVTCGSTTIYCTAACPICTEGSIRLVPTGNCCDLGGTEMEKDVCTNNMWVFNSIQCKPRLCGPA